MARLHGTVLDAATDEPVEAKVHVLSAMGRFLAPVDSILKVGPGREFFYADGMFELEAPVGQVDIVVERGNEYRPLRQALEVSTERRLDVELRLERWTDLPAQGWHPGNTHLHYDEKEMRPDERLRFDSVVEGYGVTVISILKRREIPYASNRYPIGLFTDLSTAHHIVDVGEESRHNLPTREMDYGSFGYGHVMFIDIKNLVDPVSRGTLKSDLDPDFPPLCWACDDARDQGGTVIWCHNGRGMEAPVAAALGKIHAFNLFDAYWMDPEYRIYYEMLNAGLRLPASTGTDWFVCSSNRVYAHAPGEFSYAGWIESLRAGRTFITNGPAVFLTVNDDAPGAVLEHDGARPVHCAVRWESHYRINRVDLIVNGEVVGGESFADGSAAGTWETDVELPHDGWIAARLAGRTRNNYAHAVYAHTSPVYIQAGDQNPRRPAAARFFVDSIDRSLAWIESKGRYHTDEQREQVASLFREGRAKYQALLEPR